MHPKLKALNDILDMVDSHGFKGLKKKGAHPMPAVTSVSVEAMKPKAAMGHDMPHAEPADMADKAGESDGDELSPEMLAELLKMHGGDDESDDMPSLGK